MENSGKQEGSLTNFFVSVLWDKEFLTMPWCPPPPSPMHENFRYQNFFKTQKCSPTKFFVYTGTKYFEPRSWYPLFCIKYRNARGSLHSEFWVCVNASNKWTFCKCILKVFVLEKDFCSDCRASVLLYNVFLQRVFSLLPKSNLWKDIPCSFSALTSMFQCFEYCEDANKSSAC